MLLCFIFSADGEGIDLLGTSRARAELLSFVLKLIRMEFGNYNGNERRAAAGAILIDERGWE